jgi:hypothetical protein
MFMAICSEEGVESNEEKGRGSARGSAREGGF